jgi:Gram-negative bacterial TonB protein C-terminal
LHKGIVALLFWLACLQADAGAQRALPGDELLRPIAPPPVPLAPGSSISGDNLPVPEAGLLAGGTYRSDYFGFSYSLPPGWEQSFAGPPPSSTGHYFLAEFVRMDPQTGSSQGSILITASDQFFASRELDSPGHMVDILRARLEPVYQLEAPPAEIKLGNRTFVRLEYQSRAAELHWRVLAAEMRCHIVEFIFTSRDTRLLNALVESMNGMQRPTITSTLEQSDMPVCIQDYAASPNLVRKVDPAFAGPKFTNIPTRIIIGKNGMVKQVHVISAFPEQAESVKAALAQWQFKPYVEDGRPREVETGLMFSFPSREGKSQVRMPASSNRSW